MSRYISSVFLILFLLISGCASTKQAILPSLRIVDLPTLGEEHSVELGDTLVQKGKFYTYDGIRLENTVSAGDGYFLKKFTVRPDTLKANMFDDERIYFTNDKLEVFDGMLGTQMKVGGLAISKSDNNDIMFHSGGQLVFTPEPQPIYSKVQITDVERPSFRQELIYNGKYGDTLRFLYREYSIDLLRAPFTQEVHYDLKDGNIIGFKGVRIEIIEATNFKLKYRVKVSFPDAS